MLRDFGREIGQKKACFCHMMEKYLLTSKIEGEGGESRQGDRGDGCGRRDGGREREGVNRRFSLFFFFYIFPIYIFSSFFFALFL